MGSHWFAPPSSQTETLLPSSSSTSRFSDVTMAQRVNRSPLALSRLGDPGSKTTCWMWGMVGWCMMMCKALFTMTAAACPKWLNPFTELHNTPGNLPMWQTLFKEPLPSQQTQSNLEYGSVDQAVATAQSSWARSQPSDPPPIVWVPDGKGHYKGLSRHNHNNQPLQQPAASEGAIPANSLAPVLSAWEDSRVRSQDEHRDQHIANAIVSGDPWEAIRLLEASLEDTDEHDCDTLSATWARLVSLLEPQGAYIKCLYYMRRLLDTNPQDCRLHEHLAKLLLKMEDLDGTIESYQSAMFFGQTPVQVAGYAKTLSLLHYEKRQDMAAAVRTLRSALELDQDNPELLSTLGDMHFEQGDYHAALGIYQTLLEFEPKNAELHTYLGYLYWQLDDNRKAIAAYEVALELKPDNPIALNNLGVIYLDSCHQAEAAYPYFVQACKLKSTYAMAQFNRGRSLEQMDKTQEARLAYQLAHRLNEVAEELPGEEILNRLVKLNPATM
jgi:Flp pilus assembly protein TadD